MSIDVALFIHRAVVLPIRTLESIQLYSLRVDAGGNLTTNNEGIRTPSGGVISLALANGVYGWSSASPVSVMMLDGVTAVTRSAKETGGATSGGSKDPWPMPPPPPPSAFSSVSPQVWATLPDAFMAVAGA